VLAARAALYVKHLDDVRDTHATHAWLIPWRAAAL